MKMFEYLSKYRYIRFFVGLTLHYIVRNTRSMTTSKYFMSGEAVVDRIAHAAYLIFQILFFASFVSTAYPFVFHIIVPHTDFQRSKISVSHFQRVPGRNVHDKKCKILQGFYAIIKHTLSLFFVKYIPANLHKQEVDVFGQHVGFDTHRQDKKFCS